jgi:hypothetical protein
MDSSLPRYLALLAFVVGIAARYLSSRRYRHPPGPRPLPFIGNVLQIPPHRPEDKFAEWGAAYGLRSIGAVPNQVLIPPRSQAISSD